MVLRTKFILLDFVYPSLVYSLGDIPVAILSGNIDLLEKALLEKKVAALESERKSFGKNKANTDVSQKDALFKIKQIFLFPATPIHPFTAFVYLHFSNNQAIQQDGPFE